MINVLIDVTGVTLQKAGVGVYGKELVHALLACPGIQLFVLAQDDDPDFGRHCLPGATLLPVPSRWMRKRPVRLVFEQTVLPFLISRYRIDVVHSLHYSFPLLRRRAKVVVTIHDMTWFSMPEVHQSFKKRYHRFFIERAGRVADGLIFVSRSALADFRARFGSPRGEAVVIHHGRDPRFQPSADEAAIDDVRRIYHLSAAYILYVGTIEPRKNLVRLVEAFARIAPRHPGTQLVLAGNRGWMYGQLFERVQQLALGSRVLFPGFVPEAEKPALMAGCTLFVYPSLYEGFGLPALEAIASGVPVVTSNTSSLPEVVGEAALLVDPADVDALAEAMERILTDPALRDRLRREGPRQAARFTWRQTAGKTADLYRSVHSQDRPARSGRGAGPDLK